MANAVVLGDKITAFDCIEFDASVRWIDVQADIAFLGMDLMAHGRRDMASGVLDTYLAHSGDYEGTSVQRFCFYLVYRALVRAQVGLIRERQACAAATHPSASNYFELARARVRRATG